VWEGTFGKCFWISAYLGQVAMRLCPSWCWCWCDGAIIEWLLYDGVGSEPAGVDSAEKSGCLIPPRYKVTLTQRQNILS
jgi:hypothetical protein